MSIKTLTGVYVTTYDLKSPVSTLSITSTGYLGDSLVAMGTGAYTVVNQGFIGGATGAVSIAGHGVITNAGTIAGHSTTTGYGVILGNGGTVTNQAGARISGYFGVVVETQSGTIANNGTIAASGKYGVVLEDGGLVTNGDATHTGASIRGQAGVWAILATTVHNYGTIVGVGTSSAGGYLKAGGVVTNGSATDTTALLGGQGAGFESKAGAATLTNYGTVRATGTTGIGAVLYDGGVLTNGSAKDTTALVEGTFVGMALATQAGTLNNFGTVVGGYAQTLTASGAYLLAGGVVNNGSASDTAAKIGGFIGVNAKTGAATVNNYGIIGGAFSEAGVVLQYGGSVINGSTADTSALIQGYIGVAVENHAATVHNYGTIESGFGPASIGLAQPGVFITASGVVTNGSATDTKALITGLVGVYATSTSTGTVTNFGSITTSYAGVILSGGGQVTNGSTSDTGAAITGSKVGVGFTMGLGTVTNLGTISASALESYGVLLSAGGVVTNGSSSDKAALIQGFTGLAAKAGGKVANSGTILGSTYKTGVGAVLAGGASLTNNAGALITGYVGVDAGPSSTVTSFGSIHGTGGMAVILADSTSRLNAEDGSVFKGVIEAGSALVDVVSGLITTQGIVSSGKINGAGTLRLSGGASQFETGVSLGVARIAMIGATTTAEVSTNLSLAQQWSQTDGSLTVDSGKKLNFSGAGDTFSGTVTGAGSVGWIGGSDTLSALTLSAAKMTISTATVTLAGTIAVTGVVSVTTPHLIIDKAGATLSGGEWLLSDTATNQVTGASATAKLTNLGVILGAGKLGAGSMVLSNGATGLIENADMNVLTIDTGSSAVVNAGTIKAYAGGGVTIKSVLTNTGTLITSGGPLSVLASVNGAGLVRISGGVAKFLGSFNEAVIFGTTGQLYLAHSQTYAGTISGFSKTSSTSIDLADIAFGGTTTATYAGTSASGILTVTDGTHTAKINFKGDYTSSTWTVATDGGTGTLITDPIAKPSVHAMAAAAATLGASASASAASHSAPQTAVPALVRPTG